MNAELLKRLRERFGAIDAVADNEHDMSVHPDLIEAARIALEMAAEVAADIGCPCTFPGCGCPSAFDAIRALADAADARETR